jgi:hypothetical protein
MNRFLIVPIAVIVCIGVSISPGKPQDKRPNQGAKNSQTSNEPANKSARPPDQAADENQNQSKPITPGTEERAIRVASLPPVAVKSGKDGWDKALVIFTGLIVIVGGFQIYFLYATVAATKDNARAAVLNAQAVISAERAWIEAELERDKTIYLLKITNQGKTPAWIEGYDIYQGPLEEGRPFDLGRLSTKTVNIGALLGTDRAFEPKPQFSFQGEQQGAKLAFCIKVRYRDVLDRPKPEESKHESFIFYYVAIEPGIPSMRRISVESKYT